MPEMEGFDAIHKFIEQLNRLSRTSNITMEEGKIRGQGVGTKENLVQKRVSETAEEADFENRYTESRLEGEGKMRMSEDEVNRVINRAFEDVLEQFFK